MADVVGGFKDIEQRAVKPRDVSQYVFDSDDLCGLSWGRRAQEPKDTQLRGLIVTGDAEKERRSGLLPIAVCADQSFDVSLVHKRHKEDQGRYRLTVNIPVVVSLLS